MRIATWLTLLYLLFGKVAHGQDTLNEPIPKSRKVILGSAAGLVTVGSLVGLNQAWYKEYNTGSFHFFNDNKEWLQMDKAGHIYTTYQTSRLMMECFDWAGFSEKKKLWVGGTIGFFYMTAIEVMDGFSRGWGYSWGDQLADAAGTALAMSQAAAWKEQRIQLKFSFAQSGLAKYNPGLLGKNQYSQIIKDYNGQTYWLSINPSCFMKNNKGFPKWLNLALGYSAYGMLGGHYNRIVAQDDQGNVFKVERARRYYFSLDVDLTRIKTKSKILGAFFSVFNILKFPAPAMEFSGAKWRFYPLYY